jgi:2,4-dienoyl-CoA reductase-like NADH-dependent reductase (Old Yellow Enzyme family)
MYAQLWHTGAMSHPDFFGGALPMSASAVNPEQVSVTPSGRKPTVVPRPMSKAEIRQTVTDFGVAAKNALEAGFDGVQIQANYLYLIAQFLNSATTDFVGTPLEHLAGDGMFEHFRPLYNGHLIANVDMPQERANRLIAAGVADSIAFGRPYIANPDLPERFLTSAPLNQINWPTVYASGPKGYIDYPALLTTPSTDS